jgi:hypothetical protein
LDLARLPKGTPGFFPTGAAFFNGNMAFARQIGHKACGTRAIRSATALQQPRNLAP